MNFPKIAIFIDVENLTKWVKDNGPERLISELSVTGPSIVRRAYGNWSSPHIQNLQISLTMQGFELIHNCHPVSGKNSSDIQLTIDVMEHALRLQDVEWIVLATGDSDFSPLFRKLREMGKEVIGVGPKSPLSESVKTSCSKYIYTEISSITNKDILNYAVDDAVDLAEKAFAAFDGPVVCSALKVAMVNIDSAFDEKAFGYKSFTDFLKNVDSIRLHFDPISCVWTAFPSNASFPNFCDSDINNKEENSQIPTEELYRRFLRKRNWRLVPKDLLFMVYDKSLSLDPHQKSEIKSILSAALGVTLTDINKAISILFKSHLFEHSCLNNDVSGFVHDERLIKIKNKEDFIRDVDLALLVRLLPSIQENNLKVSHRHISILLYGQYEEESYRSLLLEAKNEIRQFSEQTV